MGFGSATFGVGSIRIGGCCSLAVNNFKCARKVFMAAFSKFVSAVARAQLVCKNTLATRLDG